MASVQAMAYGSHNAELSSASFRRMVETKVGGRGGADGWGQGDIVPSQQAVLQKELGAAVGGSGCKPPSSSPCTPLTIAAPD